MMKVLWLSKDNSVDDGDFSDKRAIGYCVFSSSGAYKAGPFGSKNRALGALEFFRVRDLLKAFRENEALWEIVRERHRQYLAEVDLQLASRLISTGEVDVYGGDAEVEGATINIIGRFDFKRGGPNTIIALDENAKSMFFPDATDIPLLPAPKR